jgi:protein-tyrosine phosphatase
MLRTVTLPKDLTLGCLYLCSMPGRFEPLDDFLLEIKEAGVRHIVCLVPDDEIEQKSPDYLAAIEGDELPAKLWRFEIPDYGMPGNPDDLDRMLDLIRERMDAGESVVVHCAYGHGRTGTVSALLLARMGLPLDSAIQTIRRAGSSPDTPMQREFLFMRVEVWNRQ